MNNIRGLLLLAGTTLLAADGNWPQWRGSSAAGVAEGHLPSAWSAEKNIAWKAEIPGAGHSQPVVWGSRIFLTTDIEGEVIEGAVAPKHKLRNVDFLHPDSVGVNRRHTLHVLCYDAGSGKLLWDQVAYEGKAYDNRHRRNTYASPTVATDGNIVVAYFESMGLYAYSLQGKLLWKTSIGGVSSLGLGPGSSPILAGDLVVLQADQDGDDNSFLVAFMKKNGEQVWKTKRKVQSSWATPILANGQLIASASEAVIAYDPATGKELWQVPGVEAVVVHTPLADGNMLVVSSGYPTKRTLGIKLDGGTGHVAWTYQKGTAYVPSPIIYKGLLYLLTDNGTMTCLDPQTGEPKYEGKRLPAPARFMASPVAFNDKILLTSEDGDTYVVKAGPVHEVAGKNSIGEPVFSSMALAGDSIYLRAEKHLYRIRQN